VQVPSTGKMVAYLSASLDATNKPWCLDCVKAEPIVGKAIPTGFPVQFHWIASRHEWKVDPGKNHPFRAIASALPCMIRYEDGVVVKLLLEDECWDEANLITIFK
jgi:hypothetical protein